MLAGCATTSIKKDYALGNEGNSGLVIVSVSHDLAGGRNTNAIFYVDGGIVSGGSMLSSSDKDFFGISSGNEFSDSYGRLLVIALSPGRHTIDSWQIANGSGLRILPKEKLAPLTFEVTRGQIKYLGNLHANLATGKNVFGMTIVGDGYPEVRDLRQRDMSLLDNRYPQFRGKASTELLPLGVWGAGTETRRQTDIKVMPVKK